MMHRCSDHSLSPGCIVCVHIASSEPAAWFAAAHESSGEVMYDWLCKECVVAFAERRLKDTGLETWCVGCVERIMREGRPYLSLPNRDGAVSVENFLSG